MHISIKELIQNAEWKLEIKIRCIAKKDITRSIKCMMKRNKHITHYLHWFNIQSLHKLTAYILPSQKFYPYLPATYDTETYLLKCNIFPQCTQSCDPKRY